MFGGRVFQTPVGRTVSTKVLEEFNEFGREAEYLLGHNILSHDIPKLKALKPDLAVLRKPAIDTLYLSPLAFPANPYHRLVKNYQLVRDSVSDPVEDAKLAGRVFAEQWEAFCRQLAECSDIPVLYRGFLHTDAQLAGTAAALAAMGAPLLQGEDLYDAFAWFAGKFACVNAVNRLVEQLYDGCPQPVLAYVVAWLSVAGGNSVLPPWVRHHFPEVSVVLHSLRESCCSDPRCAYCTTHHNPKYFLEKFFGFSDFRPEPATEQGKSLQAEIVAAGAGSTTLFATLPTGGGKSLCYMLPAIMRYQRRNLLTIVLSPLQALMKDQVDSFSRQTGTRLATALYGMLTMPERGEVMEMVRLGDVGLLYVSPEQLRNRSFVETIRQREIGAWIFDEAHCLSKWGHDFRPDYFYAIRFIREFATGSGAQIPPVQCFTATAKRDVREEIIDTVQSELGLRVMRFEGGHERKNLHYEVFSVTRYEKKQVILRLLQERFSGTGCVVIYCATHKNTEQLAEFLREAGYTAEAFHAGLAPSLKKRILEQFIGGEVPVICATNAFGMGIDKDDVRLVLHADIPGSLENYLQEAGRAGRDRHEAECILVFDEQDIEGQFRLGAMSRLTKREIAQMLRGIRAASRGGEEAVLTAGELLRRDDVDIDPDTIHDGDTRVRTAIAWLELAPDADTGEALELDLRQVNQRLIDRGDADSSPHVLKLFLHGLAHDGKGLAGQIGSLRLRSKGNNCFSLVLQRRWESLVATMLIRQQAAHVALQIIHDTVDADERPNKDLLVKFTLEQIVGGLQRDLLLRPQLKKPLAAAERALMFMHEHRIIDLQQGLAVFRQAMRLRLSRQAKGRRYTSEDFLPLKTHYTERNFQIHVMNEYARKALEKISTAMRMVASYFNDDKEDFVQRYFPGRKKLLERATSEQSYARIVDDLKNKAQAAIVAGSAEKNMLVTRQGSGAPRRGSPGAGLWPS